jgi:tRNA(Ile)-lysidine synthase
VRTKTDTKLVLTAHHKNDDQETFFLSLVRGAGLNGLKGISEKRQHFIRPLLGFSKTELKDFALSVSLEWREDASNQTDKYLRNKVRHSVIPAFLDADERAASGMEKTIKTLKAQNDVFQLLVENYRKAHFESKSGLISLKLTEELTQYPQLLFEVLLPYGHFEVDQIIASKSKSGKKFQSEYNTVYLDRGYLLIEENSAEAQKEAQIGLDANADSKGILQFKTLNSLPSGFEYSDGNASFDFDTLHFPLVLRPWQQGDSFQPFGMKGRKKVSDYLIDAKVPLPLKNKTLVLTSQGEIVWLVGHRIDDRFKVTSKTKKIYLANLLK